MSTLFLLFALGVAQAQEPPKLKVIELECKDSAEFKKANEAEKADPACFRIADDGNLIVFRTSRRMVHFSIADGLKGGFLCKQADGSTISYGFELNRDNRLRRLWSKSGLKLDLDYHSGKCFDVTNSKVLQVDDADRTKRIKIPDLGRSVPVVPTGAQSGQIVIPDNAAGEPR